jgi:putative PIN family toxin of toxin-antitoxin system
MIRAVLDANVVISAMLAPGGTPELVARDAGVRYTLVWSLPIVEECIRVAMYARLQPRFRVANPVEYVRELSGISLLMEGDLPQVHAVHADPSDDVYLATALAGAAPFLVTGDRKHLLALKEFAGVRIVTPRQFLAVLREG